MTAPASPPLSPELSLLVSASLGLKVPDFSGLDGQRLLALARWHGVRPALLSLAKGGSANWLDQLRQECTEIALSNLLNTQETLRLSSLLEANKVPAYGYKGSLWAEWLYGEQSQREYGDIDLLVQPENWAQAHALVTENGYSPDAYRQYLLDANPKIKEAFLRSDYHVPMTKQAEGSLVKFVLEMHWRVAYPRLNFSFPASEWVDFQSFCKIQEKELRCFSNEYQFLLLVMHHGGKEQWTKLKYLADLAAYLRRHGHHTDWRAVMEMARKKGMLKLVNHGLGMLRSLKLPWQREWPDVAQSEIEARLLRAWETMPRESENSSWAYLKHTLSMRDTFRQKYAIAVSHLNYATELNLLYHKLRWYLQKG